MPRRKFLGGQRDRIAEFSGNYISTGPENITNMPSSTINNNNDTSMSSPTTDFPSTNLFNDKYTAAISTLTLPPRPPPEQVNPPETNSTRVMTLQEHSDAHDASVAHAMSLHPTHSTHPSVYPNKSTKLNSNQSKRKVTFKPDKNAPVSNTKTGHMLVQRAAMKAASFTGKFLFGNPGIMTTVLPRATPAVPTHRDKLFLKGKQQSITSTGF